MSGFFGIFRPQGGPVDLDAFEQMKTAIHREGFDGMETHVEDNIAMGHLMLRVSPESKYDKQPLKSYCGNYILVGHFRLDYRDELGDKLGLTQADLKQTPDSQLVMLAYQKWKEKCVHHLEGDWAFAIFSVFGPSLGLFRDQFGYSALFYIYTDQQLYFSSDISLFYILSFLNLKLDIEQVIRISTNTFSLSQKKTLFENLFNLEHGAYIIVTNSMHFHFFNYWELVNYPKILYKNDAEYSDHLFSLFQRSVLSKFDSNLKSAIFLSSGFDSTSVCYFLDKMAQYKQVKIFSYTSVPLFLNELSNNQLHFANEKPYVQEFLRGTKMIIPHFCNFDNHETDFLEFAFRDFFFPIATPTTFWIDGIYQEVKKQGAVRVYNGQFGNITVSNVYREYMLQYLMKFKWRSLICEFVNYSSKGGIGFFHGFKEYIFKPFSTMLSMAFVNRKTLLKKLMDESVFKGIFLKKVGLISTFENELLLARKFPQINELSLRKPQFDSVARIATINWYNYSTFYGIETIDPTSDLRLMRYSTSIPSELFNQNGISSNLFKNTFKNHLPDFLLELKFRRLQSMDIAFRLRKSTKFQIQFKELTSGLEIKHWYIKVNSIKKDFEELQLNKGLFNGYLTSRRLLKNISLINFLQKINNKF